ncbi:hypothetical protein AB1Y20_005972 [Prymnesium parvum]|uniref:ABC transmembrane type-1 domain-containing protein n=1 Tax=Prymnesium parvum TaxID=97485 RepID=A0AB34J376_PRYPA
MTMRPAGLPSISMSKNTLFVTVGPLAAAAAASVAMRAMAAAISMPFLMNTLSRYSEYSVRASQMTRQQLDTINRIDAWVFSEFGYRML